MSQQFVLIALNGTSEDSKPATTDLQFSSFLPKYRSLNNHHKGNSAALSLTIHSLSRI